MIEHASYKPQTWFNGTMVMYTCDSGYTLADSDINNHTCTLSGHQVAWSAEQIRCVPGTVR